MRVLGVETSCDETGLAVYDDEAGLLAHVLHSQTDLHAQWGGVVPELASRDHVIRLIPLLRQILPLPNKDPSNREILPPSPPQGEGRGGGQPSQNTPQRFPSPPRGEGQGGGQHSRKSRSPHPPVDGIAYTSGPGLAGALLTGAAFARSLAWAWGIPAVAVHHMEGHLLAPMLEADPPQYPFLALLVSGGHTMLVHVRGQGQYETLGETRDDAVGEAFDKTAKLLGLGYPGGAALARLAQTGRPGLFEFPRPMTARPGLEFSFSGLKTAVLQAVERSGDDAQTHADIARGFEDAVIDTLTIKCARALKQTGLRSLVIAGGVSANIRLRERLRTEFKASGVRVYYPRQEFCTDNGAMIAYAGLQRLRDGGFDASAPAVFEARPRWPIDELTA